MLKGWKTILGAFAIGGTKILTVAAPLIGMGAFGDKAQAVGYGVGAILLGTGVAGKLEGVRAALLQNPPKK